MELTQRQRTALEAICETFCPPSHLGLPSARELGVAEAVVAAMGAAPRAEQTQLAMLLSAWDTPALGMIGPSSRERKLQEGCVKLGWHVEAMPRAVRRLRSQVRDRSRPSSPDGLVWALARRR